MKKEKLELDNLLWTSELFASKTVPVEAFFPI